MVFLLWVPIPYVHLSFPESRACNGLGEEIAKFLAAASRVVWKKKNGAFFRS
jgi:hypothetical protein